MNRMECNVINGIDILNAIIGRYPMTFERKIVLWINGIDLKAEKHQINTTLNKCSYFRAVLDSIRLHIEWQRGLLCCQEHNRMVSSFYREKSTRPDADTSMGSRSA